MNPKKKLELTWIGKEERPRLEPRILIEQPEHSMPAADGSEDNILIHGDNLLALKALEAKFTGAVKCIYIDPPFNTGNAFEHYDDSVEHSLWLDLMRQRIEILRNLLREDGFFCAHIDDGEGHYLKVMLDELFGRSNYLTTFYVQVRYSQKTLKQDMNFHKQVEMVHIYRKSPAAQANLPEKTNTDKKYKYYVDEIGEGQETILGGKKVIIFKSTEYKIKEGGASKSGLKEIWATGTILDGNSSGRFFRDYLGGRVGRDGLGCLYKVFGIGDDGLGYRYFTGPKRESATKGKYFQGMPVNRGGENVSLTTPIPNFYDFAANFGNCRHEGGVEFRSGKKPEILLRTIIESFSSVGDIVLDSFAGSGTTGAVAQKMGRRWIMVELGEHAWTHVVPRLRSVTDGTDRTGITEASRWTGGGGFRFFHLASSMLERDRWDNWIVSKHYNPAMLAEAMCRHMGFTYAPSQDPQEFWRHGQSTESDFIYVTTQALTHEVLAALSRDVGPDRHLLICCKAWSGKADAFANLTLRKIPQAVLSNCEWGRDDYSFRLSNAPAAEEPDDADEVLGEAASGSKKRGRKPCAAAEATSDDLFAESVEH